MFGAKRNYKKNLLIDKPQECVPKESYIPTMRDVSAFTMVSNLIIGSLPRATSRKRNPRKDKNKVTPLPRKTQCSERDIARVEKNSIHEILRQTAPKNSKNEETEVNKRK